MNGYLKLWRSIRDWEWYLDANVYRVFTHLLTGVNHAPARWKGVEIQAGQMVTSRQVLAQELQLSEQQIRTALTKLKSTNDITIKATNKYTLVTLVNWAKYQSNEEFATSKLTSNPPNEQPTNNQQITTNKKDKNKENEKEVILPSDKPTKKQGFEYQEIFDHYLSLELIEHKALNKKMKDCIDVAIRACGYTVEDMKKLLDRHKAKVEETKNSEFKVKARPLYEFFGQKAFKATHLICQDYEDGGKYAEAKEQGIDFSNMTREDLEEYRKANR